MGDEQYIVQDQEAYGSTAGVLNPTVGVTAGTPDFDIFGAINNGLATVTKAATSALQIQSTIQGLQDTREDRALARYIRQQQIDTTKTIVPLQADILRAQAQATLQRVKNEIAGGLPADTFNRLMLLVTVAGVIVGAVALLKH